MKPNKTASTLAFLFVLLVFGGSFVWWVRTRPSYLIYQAHSQVGKENQAAVVARYEKLLSQENLDPLEETRLRMALGEFYLGASHTFGTVVLKGQRSPYNLEHPFLEKAKREFDRILELDANHARAHYLLGRLLLYKQLETYGIDELKKALELDPKLVDALYFLSLTYRERDQPELARDYALRALSINSKSDQSRWALIQSYTWLGKNQKAVKEYKKLSVSFREAPRIRSFFALTLAEQNQWDLAEQEMKAAGALDPDDHWVRVNTARLLLRQGEINAALGELITAEKMYPSSIWPVFWLTKVNAQLGDCYRANQTSQLLVEFRPRWPSSHLSHAWTHLCYGREKEAQWELEEAIRLAPKFVEARELLVQILMDKNDFRRLGTLIRPWLDDKMNQTEAYTLLAQSFYRQGNYEWAKEMAESAIRMDSYNPWPFVWLAMSRLETKEKAAAERSFQNALNLTRYDDLLRGVRAVFLAKMGHDDQADDLLQDAIQSNPRLANLWLFRGDQERKKKFHPEAIRSYQRALQRKPYLLNAHMGLIEIYWQQKEMYKADLSLTKALSLNSKDPQVLLWRGKIRKQN